MYVLRIKARRYPCMGQGVESGNGNRAFDKSRDSARLFWSTDANQGSSMVFFVFVMGRSMMKSKSVSFLNENSKIKPKGTQNKRSDPSLIGTIIISHTHLILL